MPVKFKNRWGYGAVAFLGAMAVLPFMILILSMFDGRSENTLSNFKMDIFFGYGGLIGIHAAISAMICWPFRTKRTTGRMVLARVFTVVLAFVLMEFSITLFQGGLDFSLSMSSLVLWVVLGRIFTLGLPYLSAIFLSLLFIDWPSDI